MAEPIVPMKAKNGGEIIYRPQNHLKLFPDLVQTIPSQREEKTTSKKEAK